MDSAFRPMMLLMQAGSADASLCHSCYRRAQLNTTS